MKAVSAALLSALLFTAAPALIPALASVASAEMSQSQIEESLTCQCGCGLTVGTCNHMQCGFGIPVKDDVRESLARGETGEEILARYQAEYGEKILSSPTTTGFNLLAWTGPYIAVGLGALGLIFAFRRWGVANQNEAELAANSDPAVVDDGDDAQREQLRRELEELDS
jgi:cytochrome c-type biogenesis protein CcmH/NrfF